MKQTLQQEINQEERLKELFLSSLDPDRGHILPFITVRLNEAFNKLNGESRRKIVSKVKVGDIFNISTKDKTRPFVVYKAGKEYSKVISLTSTENVHNTGIKCVSRFLREESFYAYSLDTVPNDFIAKNFIGTVDKLSEVREVSKEIIRYYSEGIKI